MNKVFKYGFAPGLMECAFRHLSSPALCANGADSAASSILEGCAPSHPGEAQNAVLRMYALAAAVVALCAGTTFAADDLLAWQTEARPVMLKDKDLGGQILRVGLDPETKWPVIRREMEVAHSRHNDLPTPYMCANRGASPITFGAVYVPGADKPELEDCSRTWADSSLEMIFQAKGQELLMHQAVFGDDDQSLSVAASRFVPWLEIRAAGGLALFAGLGAAGMSITRPARYGGFTGSATPAWYAVGSDSGVTIKPMSELADMPLEGLDKGWLLCWYGRESWFFGATRSDSEVVYGWDGADKWKACAYPADSPFLILFSEAPAALSAEKLEGLTIEPSSELTRVLVLPVMGEIFPRAEDTEKWGRGLPVEIIERCDWWAAHTDLIPTGVEESYAFDESRDSITVTEMFTFERFREQGEARLAPVPPLMATAHLTGFSPLSFSIQPENPNLFTSIGDFLAVPNTNSYEMRFDGLMKYATPRPSPAGPYPEPLVAALEDEVKRTIEAGHLAPWVRIKKNCDGWAGNFVCTLVNAMPGEQLWLMSEALPFLSPDLRAAAVAWMQQERESYPPEAMPLLPTGVGARREWHPFSAEFLDDKAAGPQDYNNINRAQSCMYFVRELKLAAPITPYYLAAYYAAAGADEAADDWDGMRELLAPYLGQLDWAGLYHQWPEKFKFGPGCCGILSRRDGGWYGTGGVTDAHQLFAGALGLARLAGMAGDKDSEHMAYGLFARFAAARHAMAKMSGRLYELGLLTPAPKQNGAQDDIRVPYAVDEFGMTVRLMISGYHDNGLTAFRDAVPELGALARDWFPDETMRYFDNMAWHIPHWHAAWCEQGVENESGCPKPQDTWQTFMAYAWIAKKPGPWLEARLDLPWTERGDLYYMHKLVETIRASAPAAGQ